MDKAQSEGNELIVVRKPVEKSLLEAAIRATPGLLVDERRRFRRVPVSVEVLCREGPHKFVGRTVDLSEYGMQVESDKALEERHSVNLMFTLPGQIKPIEAMGVVVRQVDEQRSGILIYPARQPCQPVHPAVPGHAVRRSLVFCLEAR